VVRCYQIGGGHPTIPTSDIHGDANVRTSPPRSARARVCILSIIILSDINHRLHDINMLDADLIPRVISTCEQTQARLRLRCSLSLYTVVRSQSMRIHGSSIIALLQRCATALKWNHSRRRMIHSLKPSPSRCRAWPLRSTRHWMVGWSTWLSRTVRRTTAKPAQSHDVEQRRIRESW
jgi:hypothetical protein